MSERLSLNLGTRLATARDVLGLVYADRDGAVSTRVVTVQEAWGRQDERGRTWVNWLVGYCHLRTETRHFYVRGIVSITTPNGNIIDRSIEAWLAGRYAIRRHEAAPDPPPQAIFAEAPQLTVVYGTGQRPATYQLAPLTFIGRLEGRARRINKGGKLGEEHDRWFYPHTIQQVSDTATGELIPDLAAWAAQQRTEAPAPVAGTLHAQVAAIHAARAYVPPPPPVEQSPASQSYTLARPAAPSRPMTLREARVAGRMLWWLAGGVGFLLLMLLGRR